MGREIGMFRGTKPQELTEEQRRLVEENIMLVPFALHKFVPHLVNEDNLQMGYIGLCEAAKENDATKGYNFSTFAVTRILWKVRHNEKSARYQKRWINSKEAAAVRYEGEWLNILDTVPDQTSVEESAIFRYNLSRLQLTDEEKRIIRLLLSGLSTRQVEKWEKLGRRMSRGVPIDRLMGRIREKWEMVNTKKGPEGRRWLLNKERPKFLKQEHLEYLDQLRENNKINMFDAIPYLKNAFPYLLRREAQEILRYWMITFRESHKSNGKRKVVGLYIDKKK
jgi:hypothetical protein